MKQTPETVIKNLGKKLRQLRAETGVPRSLCRCCGSGSNVHKRSRARGAQPFNSKSCPHRCTTQCRRGSLVWMLRQVQISTKTATFLLKKHDLAVHLRGGWTIYLGRTKRAFWRFSFPPREPSKKPIMPGTSVYACKSQVHSWPSAARLIYAVNTGTAGGCHTAICCETPINSRKCCEILSMCILNLSFDTTMYGIKVSEWTV